MTSFRSLRELKHNLMNAKQLQFCDICVESRKVGCPPTTPALTGNRFPVVRNLGFGLDGKCSSSML